MANFQQVQPIQYKEYVSQNPLEAMTMVGVQREQKLAEGIQAVNAHMSQVEGLDILRPVDQQYLKSNLTALKTGVAKNLSGDFSDSRITNQITSAAKKIYKDPQIQNAILSTAQVRKGMTEMDEARKKGENGPSNDAAFNEEVSNYMNSTDIATPFNYKYEKYTDVNKHVFDIVGKLHPSGLTEDEAFTYSTDPVTGKTTKTLNESVMRNGFKGIEPDQIKDALRAGLSPQDWRQLELDGVYNYSNLPDGAFAEMVQKSYGEIAAKQQEKLKLLDNASTTSAAEQAALDQKKAKILKDLDNLKKEYEGVTSTFALGDTKAGKAKLHTLRTINNLASSLSYGEIESTYVGDTPQQMEKWRQTNAQELQKWQAKFEQDERIHYENRADKKEELRLKKAEVEGYGSLGTTLSQEEVPAMTMEKFNKMNNEIGNSINQSKSDFLSSKKLDPNSQQAKDWYAAKQMDYETRPSSLDPITLNHFKNLEAQQRELNGNIALGAEITKNAEKSSKKILEFVPKDAQSLMYADANGRTIFDPKDFVSFNQKVKKYEVVQPSSSREAIPVVTIDLARAKQELSSKEYKLLEIYSKRSRSTAEQQIMDESRKYAGLVNIPFKQELNRISESANIELNNRLLIKQGTSTALPTGSAAQKASLDGVLAQFTDYANQYGNGKIGNTDVETLAKLQKDNNKSFTLVQTPGNRYQQPINKLIVTASDGSKHEIPMSEQQKIEVIPSQFLMSPVDQAFSHIENQLQKAGGFSTQLGPKPFLGNTDFKSVKNYGVKANVEKDPNGGGYILKLGIHDPITKAYNFDIPYPSSSLISKEGVLKVLNELDDAAIFQMLNNKTPTAQDLDLLQKSVQKPFKQ